ncbi:uncharacterized protein BO66DRAFT_332326 [Aspergillus aculeatinus CBS 121060]|uniref:Uncharacterized protein n=1 Tax=Aspergillus aculeatinus CBS 121060 TaxID=1448322 RepID=A0ACD1GXZ1_9EURO|nr:hypothetical protein BO66DRAFT_332326 [Aspergillus aculeatinus CBS 121060]RAH66064.1 hypothetical protein BO66DRAFT_332326 [Aspergillus aculeatinus CBS 121060]
MDSEHESEPCSFHDPEQEEDDGSLRPMIYTWGLSKDYVENWSNEDAFRELYQNWWDGVLSSFHLGQREFKTEIKDTRSEIQIRVYKPNSTRSRAKDLLGYITYKERYGGVVFTNFEARLTARDLDIGGTTKRGDDNQALAGRHGDGLKLAALVLCRNGFRVQIVASGFKLYFGFKDKCKSQIYCKISPISASILDNKREQCRHIRLREKPNELASDPSKDVCVSITKGQGAAGVTISPYEFKEWMRVALDLDISTYPSFFQPFRLQPIQTEYGDIILHSEFRDRVYFKGILLSRPTSEARKYRYGYNLLTGETDRGRQSLASPTDEALVISRIWASAFDWNFWVTFSRYQDLFESDFDYADVTLVEKCVAKPTAEAIWKRLAEISLGRFYYCPDLKETDPNTIITNLRRKPAGLPKKTWQILRTHNLVRTPDEEIQHCFKSLKASTQHSTQFSRHIQRGLAACLAMHSATRTLSTEYVTTKDKNMTVLFSRDTRCLKVHDKYLKSDTAHGAAPCLSYEMSTPYIDDQSVFFCDHLVEDLYGQTLEQVINPPYPKPVRSIRVIMTTTPFNVHEAQFSGLDSEELYFPLVATNRDMSIYGLAPDAIAPEPRSSGHGLAVINIPFHAKPDDIMYSDEDEDPETTSIRQYGPRRLCSQVVPSIGSTGYSTPTSDGETMSCLPVCAQRMKELAKERELEHGKRIEWNEWVTDNFVVQFEKLIFPRRSQVSSVAMLYY